MYRSRLIAVFFISLGILNCNAYNLAGKVETPGDNGPLYVISTNIPTTLSTGGTFDATVTFNRAANINTGGISFNNGASITNLATTDKITWTFTIVFPSSGMFTVFFGTGITDQTGGAISPSSVLIDYTYN